MPFEFRDSKLNEVKIVKPKVFDDSRGWFMETYEKKDFKKAGIDNDFIQENHSKSSYGVLRGLHWQKKPYTQAKLIRCLRGIIFDVAVDLKQDSDTFGEYVSVILSEYNKKQLFIPRGFGHGFLALSDKVDVAYKVDNDYAPDYEAGLIWNDSKVDIDWPTDDPILSEKDKNWPTLEKLKEQNNLF